MGSWVPRLVGWSDQEEGKKVEEKKGAIDSESSKPGHEGWPITIKSSPDEGITWGY